MSHFRVVQRSLDIGCHDDIVILHCSNTVKRAIETDKPAGRAFTASATHNSKWLELFHVHTDSYPRTVDFKRNSAGRWFARANHTYA